MKTFTTTFLVLFMSVSLFAQERNNELRLNVGTTILGLYPEFTFERIVSEDIGVGLSLGFGAGDEFPINFNFTPFVRWYFVTSHATNRCVCGTGFFIEGNAAVFSPRWGTDNLDAGFGLGVGWKHLSTNNWTGEVLLGVGRGFTQDYSFYPRIGVSIGRRF